MSSEVYFAQRRATQGGGLLEKLEQLCDAAGFGPMLGGGAVAVRVSFGEVGNTTFMRPPYVQRVVRRLRHYGAQPFLADTLHPGSQRRGNAVEHLAAAASHGWASADGAPLVVADGLMGGDERVLPARGNHLAEARVAAAIAEADGIVMLGHFTGNEQAGFSGALFGLGYAAASLAGKREIFKGDGDPHKTSLERMVEAAGALRTARERKIGFVNLLVDLTPGCDNLDWSDAAVVPDIGILASRDPVAIDQASVDLFQQAPGIPGTRLSDLTSRDKLRDLYPGIDWEHTLRYAEQQGLGTRDYELMII